MKYLDSLAKAIENSRRLGLLEPDTDPDFTSPVIPEERVFAALRDFTPRLYEQGLSSSSSLSGNCIQVHDQLQSFLSLRGINTHMTIGSMHGEGWSYCVTSVDKLKSELLKPNKGGEIRVHTWLTLGDASIIDWTGQAWYDVQVHENHPAERCLVYFPQGGQNETHYYIPYLVGRDYLIKTHCVTHEYQTNNPFKPIPFHGAA